MRAKYEILADHLRRQILKSPPGRRLPPVRQLAKTRGFSPLTVQRALSCLKEEGYVVCRQSVGIFSAYPQHTGTAVLGQAKRRILLLVPIDWDMELVRAIQRVLAERGFLFRLHRYNLDDPAERWLPRLVFDGVVLVGSCPAEGLEVLKTRKVPLVAQGAQHPRVQVDHTCGDEKAGGAFAARHLIDLGHRRIAVLVNVPHGLDGLERLQGFINQARAMGVTPTVLDANLQWGQDHWEAAGRMLEPLMAGEAFPFTGLFSIVDSGAMMALRLFYRYHIRVPDQVSVIGADNDPCTAYLSPPLTTLGYDLRERAEALVQILELRFAGDTSPRIRKMFKPRLIERESTGRNHE